MRGMNRSDIVKRLRAKVDAHHALILAGAGTGLVAKVADRSGIDAIMCYNTGPFRMDGHGSLAGYLAYGDANAITLELTRHTCAVVSNAPVVAGVGAADPYRSQETVVDALLDAGASGITNVPTAGIYDGTFRRQIDATGLGYQREVELIEMCAAREVFTVAYAFDAGEASAMAAAGADVIGAHVGLTSGGMIGAAEVPSLDECCQRIGEMAAAIRAVRQETLVVAHGGPLENPEAVAEVLERTGVDGYLGASSIERLAIERAVAEAVSQFRALRVHER
jgi:predicted TIM-barrel enzyme